MFHQDLASARRKCWEQLSQRGRNAEQAYDRPSFDAGSLLNCCRYRRTYATRNFQQGFLTTRKGSSADGRRIGIMLKAGIV